MMNRRPIRLANLKPSKQRFAAIARSLATARRSPKRFRRRARRRRRRVGGRKRAAAVAPSFDDASSCANERNDKRSLVYERARAVLAICSRRRRRKDADANVTLQNCAAIFSLKIRAQKPQTFAMQTKKRKAHCPRQAFALKRRRASPLRAHNQPAGHTPCRSRRRRRRHRHRRRRHCRYQSPSSSHCIFVGDENRKRKKQEATRAQTC